MSTKAPNPVDKYVGSRVRMRRIMLGMSQEKLGEALGLTFQQVQKYEKGTNRVGASRLQQISEILQVPVSFLFDGGPSGTANAEDFSEGTLAGLCLRFPRDLRGTGADPRVHAHRRCQTSAQHRRTGRTDRHPRSTRQALSLIVIGLATSQFAICRGSGTAPTLPSASSQCNAGHDHADDRQPFRCSTILDGIRRWVEIETPTEAPGAGQQARRAWSRTAIAICPSTIERVAGHSGCGDHLVARSSWGQDAPGILVLSHLDTVHPLGFIERLPFRIEGDSAFGPGIYDMKGGAYLAYHAFSQICAASERPPLGITHLFVSDEEIGSPTSRALIEAEGRKAKYVLVTEPARDGGKIVTGRKGVARFEVFIKGVPSHAGTRPEDGRSAIRELGNVIQALEAMNDLSAASPSMSASSAAAHKPNVIAEEAYAEIDMRVPTIADADELVPKILGLKSRTDGVSVSVTGELNRPPYEKGNAGAALYEHAKTLAAEIGFDLVDTFTGGGSDGNFTAPHTATLDGLGVDGKGAHTHYEQMYISSIEPRARLLYRLYQTLR